MTNDHDLPRPHDPLGDRERTDLDRRGEGDGLVLHEEELRVRTERIPTGRVTFRKRIVSEERTLVVTVRREELEIVEDDGLAHDAGTHTPGAAGAGDHRDPTLTGDSLDRAGHGSDDLRRTPEGDFEIVLRAEEPLVTMQTVGVERVRVHVGTVTENRQFTEQVSREEAVLEDDRDLHGRHDAARRGDLGGDDLRGHDDHRGPRL